MQKKFTISDSELEVLKEFWETPSLTARQLTDRLLQRTDWSEPTIKTLLLRLLQKNAVKRRREDKVFIYSAGIDREEYRYMAGRSLLDRLFDGMAGDFLTCLVRKEKMTQQEIYSLKKLLDKVADK
ncbi:MAG: BlaI/MecI/CopY family transcriptional regulator [Lentisphaerae bacterium]|nr:BlaI/MecI/CopY family transcriptional regulator [Lentisphaerota bacterium]